MKRGQFLQSMAYGTFSIFGKNGASRHPKAVSRNAFTWLVETCHNLARALSDDTVVPLRRKLAHEGKGVR